MVLRLLEISSLTVNCSSVAAAIDVLSLWISLAEPWIATNDSLATPILPRVDCILSALTRIVLVDISAFSCSIEIMVSISPVDSCVRCAKERTSSATTAKPRPCSPARAASIAAFNASKLVCSAIALITSSTLPTLLDSVASC
ncbi:Uncharacterised protein [Vibrio cholerae]|uniref:Uncharacterized protein n=1 Tax=Vibrio cholerae TaxID=666 RepID=A0A655UMB2_VIBCL|nr:Uncharacterised protein [Vibrio cholerae]CSC39647.1 Uncharacterised protein [Vibrio cholerae]